MKGNSELKYLHSLKGKSVSVYKSGPEATSGKLITMQPGFIALETDDDGIIFYQTNHLKSVIEDSRLELEQDDSNESNTDSTQNDEENEELNNRLQAPSVYDLLCCMKECPVRINRGGPDSRKGTLLSVQPDYLVMQSDKEGVVYYQLQHIKSMTDLNYSKNNNNNNENTTNEETADENASSNEVNNTEATNTVPKYVDASSFDELLTNLINTSVVINGGGPEEISGVLVSNSEDFIVLVYQDEVHRLTKYHIKNISHAYKDTNNNNNNNSQNSSQNNQNSNNKNNKQEKSNEKSSNENNSDKNKNKDSKDKNKDSSSNKNKNKDSKDKNKDSSSKNKNKDSKDKNKDSSSKNKNKDKKK